MKAPTCCPRELLILLCLASIIHLFLWAYGQNSPSARRTNDSPEYLRAAENFLSSGTFYSGRMDRQPQPAMFSRRPPLYPLLIAALRSISKDTGLIVFVQIILSLTGAILIWKILCYLEFRRTITTFVTALFLFYPTQIIYTHLVMAEVLLQWMLLSSFYFLVRFQETEKWYHLALCNLFLGLTALTKPVMVYFWVPNLFFHIWWMRRLARQKLILLALIPLSLVSLWSYRNYLHTNYFHFSSIKTSNMLHVNIRGIVRQTEGKERAHSLTRELEEKTKRTQDFAEASRTVERAFFETMIKNWRTLITAYPRGSLLFFLDPGRFDIYEFLELPHNIRGGEILRADFWNKLRKLKEIPVSILSYLTVVGAINILLLAGLFYFLFDRRYPIELKSFSLLLLFYVLAIVAPTGLSRFRLSVMPFLFLSLPPLLERFSFRNAEGSRKVAQATPPGKGKI